MRGSRKVCQIGSNFVFFFLFFLVDEGREDPDTTISGPSLADDGLILNAMTTDKKDPTRLHGCAEFCVISG